MTKSLKSGPKCKTGIILEWPLNFLKAPSSRKHGPFLCSPLPEGMAGHVAFGADFVGIPVLRFGALSSEPVDGL